MKRVKFFLIIILTLLLLVGCQNKKYNVNDNIEVSGVVSNKIFVSDGKNVTRDILELDKPIVINETKVSQLELKYDKGFKDNKRIDVEGNLVSNQDNDYDISYSLEILDVNPDSAIENTFSNNSFQMTIPTSLIKKCLITKSDDGFIIYSKSNMDNGGEVFRLETVDNKRFKALQTSEEQNLEKASSNSEKAVIVIYPSNNQIVKGNEEEYEEIGNAINQIKASIRLN